MKFVLGLFFAVACYGDIIVTATQQCVDQSVVFSETGCSVSGLYGSGAFAMSSGSASIQANTVQIYASASSGSHYNCSNVTPFYCDYPSASANVDVFVSVYTAGPPQTGTLDLSIPSGCGGNGPGEEIAYIWVNSASVNCWNSQSMPIQLGGVTTIEVLAAVGGEDGEYPQIDFSLTASFYELAPVPLEDPAAVPEPACWLLGGGGLLLLFRRTIG